MCTTVLTHALLIGDTIGFLTGLKSKLDFVCVRLAVRWSALRREKDEGCGEVSRVSLRRTRRFSGASIRVRLPEDDAHHLRGNSSPPLAKRIPAR